MSTEHISHIIGFPGKTFEEGLAEIYIMSIAPEFF